MQIISSISTAIIPIIIFIIILHGILNRTDVFTCFIDGAKGGIETTVNILPSLIGLFVAISMFRASGAIELITNALAPILDTLHFPKEVLPLALMRPISGSSALAIVNDILQNYGADSFIGRVASVMMGSTETTFYTLAVYFGSVHIKNVRYTVKAALLADLTGIIASIIAVYALLY